MIDKQGFCLNEGGLVYQINILTNAKTAFSVTVVEGTNPSMQISLLREYKT